MNQAWVGGGLPPPYSAVPLLPCTSPGTPASAVPVPSVTTARVRSRRVPSSPVSSGAPAREASPASRRGARQPPAAPRLAQSLGGQALGERDERRIARLREVLRERDGALGVALEVLERPAADGD